MVRTVQRTVPFDEGLEFEEGSECWDIMSYMGDEEWEWEEVYHEEKVEEKVEVIGLVLPAGTMPKSLDGVLMEMLGISYGLLNKG
ncbi:hypothetical protein MPER_05811 [Moniliophthora perniciosa FA553]|nr:hypothetical protein MPER_05811 [Moniliophthora perniciosa FA553]